MSDPHLELMTTIANTHSTETPVPCIAHPVSAWTSDDLTEQREVAALCARCPALAACHTYLTEHGERSGVWAGTTTKDRYTNTGKPKEKQR